MGKSKSCIISIFWIFVCLNSFSQGLRDKVEQTYTSQIGVREATGKNDGAEVKSYLAITNLPEGNAWCAAFCAWVFYVNKIPAPKSAWSPAWFTRNVIYTRGNSNNNLPQKGDVFGLYYPERKRIAHIGFVHEWSDESQYVTTVEGNTNKAGSREGDGVYKKFRLKTQIYKVSKWIP